MEVDPYLLNIYQELARIYPHNNLQSKLDAETDTFHWIGKSLVSVIRCLVPGDYTPRHIELLRALLVYGLDPNYDDDDEIQGNMHMRSIIVRWGDKNLDIIKLFLEFGACAYEHIPNMDGNLFIAIRDSRSGAGRLFLDRGAKLTHLPFDANDLPDWIRDHVQKRKRCRRACITLVGVGKHRIASKQIIPTLVRIDVFRLIGQHIWSGRLEEADEWEPKQPALEL